MSSITEDKYVKDVCKVGKGENCCSYLGMGASGWECLKESSLKATIDKKREQKSMNAMSDNCDGFESVTKN